jgi:hypothetical protein
MRRPRMTTRRWMLVVAVVGLLFWTGRLLASWRDLRLRSEHHAAELVTLDQYLIPALEFRRKMGYFPGCGLTQIALEDWCKEAEWHRQLKAKYDHAARYPWLPVEPDPPEPE